MRILLVEDENAIATLVRTRFQREGLQVVCAMTVADGLRLLEGAAFDVAILDRSLPDGDGLDILAAIRRSTEHARAHVVMLSGAAAEADRVGALGKGADDYVVKPFYVSELLARVMAIARRRSITRASSSLT